MLPRSLRLPPRGDPRLPPSLPLARAPGRRGRARPQRGGRSPRSVRCERRSRRQGRDELPRHQGREGPSRSTPERVRGSTPACGRGRRSDVRPADRGRLRADRPRTGSASRDGPDSPAGRVPHHGAFSGGFASPWPGVSRPWGAFAIGVSRGASQSSRRTANSIRRARSLILRHPLRATGAAWISSDRRSRGTTWSNPISARAGWGASSARATPSSSTAAS